MAPAAKQINVYLEIGAKRTFAGALEWPGWIRSGRDEAAALQALVDYGPRYGRVVRSARLGFEAPSTVAALAVVERLKGSPSTDFGTPYQVPTGDREPVDETELRRLQRLLRACWRAFDAASETATGKPLRTGPRGGGRALEGVIQHVVGSDVGSLGQVGWKFKLEAGHDLSHQLDQSRAAILKALTAAAHGELPARGPRGGMRWAPRYFVRCVAWHVLDHAWELEDRIVSDPLRTSG